MEQSNMIKSANWKFCDSAKGLIQQVQEVLAGLRTGPGAGLNVVNTISDEELSDIRSILTQLESEVNEHAEQKVQKVYPAGSPALK